MSLLTSAGSKLVWSCTEHVTPPAHVTTPPLGSAPGKVTAWRVSRQTPLDRSLYSALDSHHYRYDAYAKSSKPLRRALDNFRSAFDLEQLDIESIYKGVRDRTEGGDTILQE